MSCSQCKNSTPNSKLLYKCDLCQKTVCNECSSLTSTEDRCMNLAKRRLKFFCSECDFKELEYEKCLKLNKQLLLENQKLQNKNQELSKLSPNVKYLGKNTYTDLNEKIIQLEETNKNLHDEIKINFINTVKDLIKSEIAHVKQEVKDLRESNKEMVKLFTDAPPDVNIKPAKLFSTALKGYQDKNKVNKSNKIHSADYNEMHTKKDNHNVGIGEVQRPPPKQVQLQVQRTNEDFHEVRRKRRKPQFGTAETICGDLSAKEFEGRQIETNNKKIWLFVSRAKSHVTEENVINFITRKTKADKTSVSVKLLNTWHKTENNNCFLVGVDPRLKDTVYDVNFWPRGVAFDRFNFNRGQRFLDKPRTTRYENKRDTDNSQQDTDFLMLSNHRSP